MRSERIAQTSPTGTTRVCQLCGQPRSESTDRRSDWNENSPELLQLERVISKAEISDKLGVAPGTIDRWTREGTFPRKLRLGPGRVGWRLSAVETWLAERGM